MSAYYIGLMSGTSLDGVDAVQLQIADKRMSVVGHSHCVFSDSLRHALRQLADGAYVDKHLLAWAQNTLTRSYAEAVQKLRSGVKIAALGCHGQTIAHYPISQTGPQTAFSWQLLNPALLACLSELPVVCDFRSADVALGGQGAPLMPAFHAHLLTPLDEYAALVNLGGICNLTLPPHQGFEGAGFDCGPANVLMDEWIGHCHHQRMDQDGHWANEHRYDYGLLQHMLSDEYFARPFPKSTGRERFNLEWIHKHLQEQRVDQGVVQATLLELTVRVLVDQVARSPMTVTRLYVAGGGAYNQALMKRLKEYLMQITVSCHSVNEFGIAPNQLEAAGFAWFAHQRMQQQPLNTCWFTGASRPHLAGSLTLP